VEASLDEPFCDAFLRFRVDGNKKHRHPFLPTLNFDAVLPQRLLNIRSGEPINVRSVVDQVGLVVPYIRNDEDSLEARGDTPHKRQYPWERTLPKWFPALPPTHWIEPARPPSYNLPHEKILPPFPDPPGLYFKVPLLHFAGNGRNTLPNVSGPPIIVSHIYIPASKLSVHATMPKTLSEDSNVVLPNDVLIPPVSTAQVMTFLGRMIRYCRHPLASTVGKKRKRQKADPYEYAAAWGWNPDTLELHCFEYSTYASFILDLSQTGTITAFHSDPDPFSLPKKVCQWLGVVNTQEDQWVLDTNNRPSAPAKGAELLDRLTAIVKHINTSPAARVFEACVHSNLPAARTHFFPLGSPRVLAPPWGHRTSEDAAPLRGRARWTSARCLDEPNFAC
jgi:hypothetical protein